MAKHSCETKKKVVLAYLSGEGGAGYIGEKYGVARAMVQKWAAAYKEFGVNNPPLITKWVNDFRIVGPDVLRSKRKGRKKTVKKSNNSTPNEQSEIESVITSIEHVKQFENELLKLKNAYLKELRRLRLEEETLLKKQRELSTVSLRSLYGSVQYRNNQLWYFYESICTEYNEYFKCSHYKRL